MERKIEFNETLKKVFASWIQEAKEKGSYRIPGTNDDIMTGVALSEENWTKEENFNIDLSSLYLYGEGWCEEIYDEEDIFACYLSSCYDFDEQIEWMRKRGIEIEGKEIDRF